MKKIILLLNLALTFNVYAQTTVILQPDAVTGKDALLHGLYSEANTNYGSNPQFIASAWTFDGTPGLVRSVINFNFSAIPANATIISAKLSLYATDNLSGMVQHSNADGPNNCWLERVTSNWDESTVTWNNQPTTTLQNRVGMAATTSPTEDYPNINVTALVQDIINNPASSFGFMIKLQTESYLRAVNFCSSDHPNPLLRPKLEVTYSTTPQTILTLQPDSESGKDALLHGLDSEVNTNYGTNPQFVASAWTFDGTPGLIRSVIDFNLSTIPSNAIVNNAQLSLYATDNLSGMVQHSNADGPNNCWLERVTSNWNELTVTWNNQPTTTPQNRVDIPATTSPTEDYPNINVTALVQDIIDNPTTSFGFMIKLQTESYLRAVNFCSSDHPNPLLRPKLVVYYSIPNSIRENPVKENELFVYPNPANDMISVKVNADLSGSLYTITDQLGRTVMTGKLIQENSNINIHELLKGIYILKVGDHQQKSIKLIKE